ncbi:hypothetical protein AB205_0020870, partial [Aquarana catesbeiana]
MSTISTKAIFEALNLLLRDRDVLGSGLSSSSLLELTHTCCVSAMSLLLHAEREGVGNRLERTSGVGDAGGVSHMRSVYQANTHVLYLRSVCRGWRNGSGERPKGRYREMRNLWEVKHNLYYNKQARRSTLEKLMEFVKTRVPDATIMFLEKKIGILRNMYKKEHNKIQKSFRSGAAAVQ